MSEKSTRRWKPRAASIHSGGALRQVAFEVVAAEAVGESGVSRDAVGANQLGERLLHGHHAISETEQDP